MKQTLLSTAVLCIALTSFGAAARPPEPSQGPGGMAGFLARFDSDGDGLVTRQEIEAVRAAEFQEADSNADGSLSYDEFVAMQQQRRAERLANDFALLDQDGNGAISGSEFSDGQPQEQADVAAVLFGLADLDADASLSLAELQALRESGHGMRRYAQLDEDGDGSVSAAEFAGAPPPTGSGRSQ
jgi:hypothetical protein